MMRVRYYATWVHEDKNRGAKGNKKQTATNKRLEHKVTPSGGTESWRNILHQLAENEQQEHFNRGHARERKRRNEERSSRNAHAALARTQNRSASKDSARDSASVVATVDTPTSSLSTPKGEYDLEFLIESWSKHMDTPTIISKVISELRGAVKVGLLNGRTVKVGLKFLSQHHRFSEAWELAREIMANVPLHQLEGSMPEITVILLKIGIRLGVHETWEVVENLVKPMGGKQSLWYHAIMSMDKDTSSINHRFNALLLQVYDENKSTMSMNEPTLAGLFRLFEYFSDIERLTEAFEMHFMDSSSPLYKERVSPQFLRVYFGILLSTSRKSQNSSPQFVRDCILRVFNQRCLNPDLPTYVAPNTEILSLVLRALGRSEDRRDFFTNLIVPYLRNHDPPMHHEQASPLILPLVVQWSEQKDFKSVIWFYERYFQGKDKICEWNTALLHLLMKSYYKRDCMDDIIQIFDEYFATHKRIPTSRTFNMLLLARCSQNTNFELQDAEKTFKDFADSLPTTKSPPPDYNQLFMKPGDADTPHISVPPITSVGDASLLASIAPGVIRAIISTLIRSRNVHGAVTFFNTYCQLPSNPYFVLPPYQSIREIGLALLEIENSPEKALTFIETTKVDSRFLPPLTIMKLLDNIEKAAPEILPQRIHAQRFRFMGLGAYAAMTEEERVQRREERKRHALAIDNGEETENTESHGQLFKEHV